MQWKSLFSSFISVFNIVIGLFVFCWKLVGFIVSSLLGELNWQRPAWYRLLKQIMASGWQWCRARPRHMIAGLFGFIAVISLIIWYQTLPQPVTIAYRIDPPDLTIFENEQWRIDTLDINFDDSVAPLEQIDKVVTEGIKLSPKIEGEWRWISDRKLRFTPKNDWPIDESYDLDFAKSGLFAEKVLLDDYSAEFKTESFAARLESSQFYLDPVDVEQKKMVSTFSFTHPVNASSFEKRLELKMADGLKFINSAQPRFTVTYDKQRLHAYVHSASLELPREDLTMRLILNDGVSAERGGNSIDDDIETSIVVPGRGSLRFSSFGMTVVDNEKFEPVQLLNFSSTAPVSEKALTGQIKAWLLPEFPENYNGSREKLYNWRSTEVSDAILKSSQAIPLTYQTGEEEFNSQHAFIFSAPVERSVFVMIPQGVTAYGGYEAIKPTSYLFRVNKYPAILKLMSEGSVLSASGSKKLGYVARGVEAVRIEVGRLLPNQLHHMLADSQNNFAKPYIDESMFNRLVERFAEIQNLPGNNPAKAFIQSINLDKYLHDKEGRKRGVFVLRVKEARQNENPDDQVYFYGSDARLIVITDLGVVAKRNLDGNYDLFVMSIASGRPVESARVELIGINGQPVATDRTDDTGHASITVQENWFREKTPLMFVVTKDNDTSFLPLNRYDRHLDFSRFDVGGIDNATTGQQLTAYAFTDRNLYRPGETAHLMFIARTADWQGKLDGLPLEVEVFDPRGLMIQRTRVALSNAGFEGVDFVSNDASLTGEYQFNISLVRDKNRRERLGGSTFTLREFEPDRLKVNATLAEHSVDGWIHPKDVAAHVQVMHLFGNPAINARIEGELTLSGGIAGFTKYPDYQFRDPAKPLQAPVVERLSEVFTDDKGMASFDLNLKRFDKASYRLHLLANAFEPGSGRSVNAQSSILVSSAPYLVGVKTDGPVNYIGRGSKRVAHWLAVDAALKKTATENLALEWIERRYVSTLAKQDDGTYRYVSRLKENLRETKQVKLAREGMELDLVTEQPGDYSYVLRNNNGEIVSRLDYTVSGAANLSRSLERNAELQLSLKNKEVGPGETLELNIRAPYAGAGLITIERDKVIAHQWFRTTTTSSVQHITVPRNLEGTAYLNVQFIRDMDSDEIYTSPLSYGVIPFSVNLEARRQQAELNVPDRVKPGDTLDIKLSTEHSVRAAVIVVDEGILQVAKFKTPDPIGFFFQKKRLQVYTSQILDLILPEFERLMQAAAAGGDDEDLLKQQLNPFKKKRQPPVVWWSGIKDVAAGTTNFAYNVPDSFNGKLRVYTIVATADKLNAIETGAEVQGDLILNPNVPMAAAPGDELVVTLGVYNNLKGKGKQSIQVRAITEKGLKVMSDPALKLDVNEGQEEVAEYRVKLTDTLGSAAIRFEAESGDAHAKITDSISVRPATPYRTVLNMGSFDANKSSINISRQVFNEYRDVNAGLAPSPLIWAQGLSAYLGGYAYSCTEQITSQAIPALILKQYPEMGNIGGDTNFDAVLRTLRSRQNDAGGFGLWAANPVVEDYVSLHVTQFLIEAKDHGINVPEDMLQNALSYVQQISGRTSQGLSGVRQRAYGIYLLARQGINPAAQLSSLKADLEERYKDQWPGDLTAAYMAATYRLLKQDDMAWRLMKNVPWRTQKSWSLGDTVYYDPLIHDAVHLYLLSRHFSEHLDTVPANFTDTLGKLLTEQRFNSLSSGLLLLALDQYHVAGGQQIGDLTIAEVNASGKSHSLPFKSGSLQRVAVSADAKSLQFNREGQGRVYHVLSESGFDRTSPESVSNGLEIQREFVDEKNNTVTSVKVGDEFFVRLRIRGTAYDESPQIAIVDLLPGGIEPVPQIREAQTEQRYGCADDGCDDSSNNNQDYSGNEGEGEEGDGESEAMPEQEIYGSWQSPLGVISDQEWSLQYSDIRDDRVVLYGNLSGRDAVMIKYRVRAVNPGTFQVPAPYAEAMYDRAQFAIGKTGKLEIVKSK